MDLDAFDENLDCNADCSSLNTLQDIIDKIGISECVPEFASADISKTNVLSVDNSTIATADYDYKASDDVPVTSFDVPTPFELQNPPLLPTKAEAANVDQVQGQQAQPTTSQCLLLPPHCYLCRRKFDNAANKIRHVAACEEIKDATINLPFGCKFCPKRFNYKHHVDMHAVKCAAYKRVSVNQFLTLKVTMVWLSALAKSQLNVPWAAVAFNRRGWGVGFVVLHNILYFHFDVTMDFFIIRRYNNSRAHRLKLLVDITDLLLLLFNALAGFDQIIVHVVSGLTRHEPLLMPFFA